MSARPAMVVLVVAFLSLGCSDHIPTAPSGIGRPSASVVTPEHGDPSEVLPFRLDGSATLLAQEFAPDFGPPLFGKSDFGGRCSEPSDLLISFSVTARSTHLGDVTGGVEHCTQIDFGSGAVSVTDGSMTLVTPAGDELNATYVGGPGASGLEEYVTFVGGTGRFATASGNGIGRPSCDQSTGACTYTLSGVLSYDASALADQ